MTIDLSSDMRGFFHDRLAAALGRQRLELGATTELYLLNLLTDFASLEPDAMLGPSLVERLKAAVEAPTLSERLRHYRDMGDSALYTCGFCSEHLERRGVSRGYIVTMGGRAYDAAGDLAARFAGSAEGGAGQVYPELARHFEQLARVLDEVRETTSLRTPQDIIRLYERWRRTGSPLLAERLRAEGVFPVAGGGKTVLH